MDFNGKKLLIQGAGRGHLGLIHTAKEMGVFTIVTGLPGCYPCTSLADKICHADIRDKETILDIAKKEDVDGIVICCSDTGLQTVGYVCDKMNLIGISEEAAILCANKFLMKEALIKNKVQTAKYMKVYRDADLQKCTQSLKFPLIVKAIDLQGSRGIYIVRNTAELISNFHNVMKVTTQNYCIVEEFIEGKEFGAQAFVYNSETLFVLPHGDETMMCRTAVPIGHYLPLDMDEKILEDARKQANKAIQALKLNNCAVNIDFIEKDGKVYIIELTGRVGANCLPELTGNYWGIDYYRMIITMALGENPIQIFKERDDKPHHTMARMLSSTRAGIVKGLSFPENTPNVNATFFIMKGSEIRPFTNCNDAIGQIIVVGTDYMDCCKLIENFVKETQIVIG